MLHYNPSPLCMHWCSMYLIYKQLQDEGCDAAIDSNEQVDGSQKHIRCARDSEHKGCWVHKRGDGPPKKKLWCQVRYISFVAASEVVNIWLKCEMKGQRTHRKGAAGQEQGGWSQKHTPAAGNR